MILKSNIKFKNKFLKIHNRLSFDSLENQEEGKVSSAVAHLNSLNVYQKHSS